MSTKARCPRCGSTSVVELFTSIACNQCDRKLVPECWLARIYHGGNFIVEIPMNHIGPGTMGFSGGKGFTGKVPIPVTISVLEMYQNGKLIVAIEGNNTRLGPGDSVNVSVEFT